MNAMFTYFGKTFLTNEGFNIFYNMLFFGTDL